MNDDLSAGLLMLAGVSLLFISIRNFRFLYSGSKGELLMRLFGKTGPRAFSFLVGLFALILGILSLLDFIDLK